jgi:ribosomal protein L29
MSVFKICANDLRRMSDEELSRVFRETQVEIARLNGVKAMGSLVSETVTAAGKSRLLTGDAQKLRELRKNRARMLLVMDERRPKP